MSNYEELIGAVACFICYPTGYVLDTCITQATAQTIEIFKLGNVLSH